MNRPPNAAPIGSAAWLDAELRTRLGEGAAIGEIAFEGRALRITGARVPLGELRLDVERAEIELGSGAPLGDLPLSLRLVSLRGTLTHPATALSIPVELTAAEPAGARWFSGRLTSPGASAGGIAFDIDAALDVAAEGARLTGQVRITDALLFGDVALSAVPAVEIDLATEGEPGSASIRGRAFASRITVGRRAAPEGACRFDDVSLLLDADRRRLRYRDLSARAHGARVTGWGRVPFTTPAGIEASTPLAALSVERAGAGLLASLAALAGLTVRPSGAPIDAGDVQAVPADLAASGDLVVMPDRTLSGAARLTTPRSELALSLAPTAGGALEGSTLRGRLAVEDAIILGMFPGPVRPRPPVDLDVDARLTGSIASPGLTGRVAAERIVLSISSDPEAPSFVLDGVSALLDATRERLAWHRFTGRFYDGTFTSSGQIGLGLDATLAFQGVRIERVPTQAGGDSRLASLLTGALSGEIAFVRHAVEGADLSARGRVTIVEPRYLFVRSFAPDLARLGLPRIRSRGRAPLSARVRFARGLVYAEKIDAALEGVEAAGKIALALDGRLKGAFVVTLLQGYLDRSPLLFVPAALAGRVTIPIDVGGSITAPAVRTDARAVLEGLLVENRVGDAVKSVLDSLGRWGKGG